MMIECVSNGGFEDQLTPGQDYSVAQMKGNSYLITNDAGQERWYGRMHFEISPVTL